MYKCANNSGMASIVKRGKALRGWYIMSNPTLSEIWLRLGKDAVKKALVDGNGKITRKGLKDLNAFSEDLLLERIPARREWVANT